MNAHFATRLLDPDGSWKNLTAMLQLGGGRLADRRRRCRAWWGWPTPRGCTASCEELQGFTQFSRRRQRGGLRDDRQRLYAEGMFWEAVNAIGVLQAPAVISI